MFTDIVPCVIFVAVFKEYNLRRRYETKRGDKMKKTNAEQKQ